jgi:hypothetical protein
MQAVHILNTISCKYCLVSSQHSIAIAGCLQSYLTTELRDVRFEVSTAVTMMIIIFWEMIIIELRDVYLWLQPLYWLYM